jgi:hypothetical protein
VKTQAGNFVRGQSAPSASWWSNDVEVLAGAAGSITTLGALGTIYVTDTTVDSGGYKIANHGISLVTLASGQINYSSPFTYNMDSTCLADSTPNTSRLICAVPGSRYLWIEAKLSDLSARLNTALSLQSLLHSRIVNTNIFDLPASMQPVIWLSNAGSVLLENVSVKNFKSGPAILLDSNSSKNILRNVRVSKNDLSTPSVTMISLENSPSNRLQDLSVAGAIADSGAAVGVNLGPGSDGTLVSGLNVSNIKGSSEASGLLLASSDNVVQRLVASSTNDAGLRIRAQGYAVSGNVVTQATFINNTYNGVFVDHGGAQEIENNYFSNLVILGASKGIETAGTPGGANIETNILRDVAIQHTSSWALQLDGSFAAAGYIRRNPTGTSTVGCAVAGPFSSNNCGGSPAIPVNLTNLELGLKGPVTSGDATNSSDDASGFATSGSVISASFDWVGFSNPFRSWGAFASGASLISPSLRMDCQSDGSGCRVWDYRVVDASPLDDNAHDPAGNAGVFTPVSSCPAPLNGSQHQNLGALNFLRHAVEDLGSWRGNKNGLCESNEDCTYAPNIGAYIGEGSMLNACSFQAAGPMTGISVRAFSQTSVP